MFEMKKLLIALFAITSLFVTSCSDDSGTEPAKEEIKISASRPNDLMPLDVGNRWEYKAVASDNWDGDPKLEGRFEMNVTRKPYSSYLNIYFDYAKTDMFIQTTEVFELNGFYFGEDTPRDFCSGKDYFYMLNYYNESDKSIVVGYAFDNHRDFEGHLERFGGYWINWKGKEFYAYKFVDSSEDYSSNEYYFVEGIGIVKIRINTFTINYGEKIPNGYYELDLDNYVIK